MVIQRSIVTVEKDGLRYVCACDPKYAPRSVVRSGWSVSCGNCTARLTKWGVGDACPACGARVVSIIHPDDLLIKATCPLFLLRKTDEKP